jgi:hypothetical protein
MSDRNDPSTTPINRMRRKELACDDAWIASFLQQARLGYIATRWDEQPFITPTNFWYDPPTHAIYFHSNIIGRLRANVERHPQAAFSASRQGRFLPANTALEFSVQYESVVAFGQVGLLQTSDEKSRALYGLIEKYYPQMKPGQHYRPIQEHELRRTAVYAMSIESWSGKRNWDAQADQLPDWPPLPDEWLEGWE